MIMKKIIHAIFFAACIILSATMHAQSPFQLPNPGFELWDGGNTSEPTYWNTFSSSDGTYASLASDNHHYRRSGGRPGTAGSHYLTLYTRSIIGIKANGNMTTGRIHAAAMSASSSNNYNYTQRSNPDHCQPFSATPDSLYVWVSYYAASRSSEAQVEAIIHGDRDFKAPNDVENTAYFKGRAVAKTTRTTDSPSQMYWTLLKVPFVYNGTDEAHYLLVNMTTNNIPGDGDANDSLSVDDITFIYSAWLNNILLQGNPINGFHRGKLDYALHVDDLQAIDAADISATPQAADSRLDIQLQNVDDSTRLALLNVTAEDSVTTRTYRLFLCAGTARIPVGIEAPQKEPLFAIYPNPARGYINIVSHADNEMLTIHNMQGQTVLQTPVSGNARIALPPLPHGCYTVTLGGQHRRLIVR